MTKCRKGFTNIELTAVIVIILLLMSMVMVGFKMLGDSGKKNATKVALETARAMLNEVQAAGVMSRVKRVYYYDNADWYDNPIVPPGKVTIESANRSDAVTSTTVVIPAGLPPVIIGKTRAGLRNPPLPVGSQQVMGVLVSMAGNRAILGKIPAEKTWKPGGATEPSMLLDGWENPIIFVPAGGLAWIDTNGVIVRMVTAMGVFDKPGDTVRRGLSGFFASAGPDGDFSTGDDNVYSFGN